MMTTDVDPMEVQVLGRVRDLYDEDDVYIPSSQAKFSGKQKLMYSHVNMYMYRL